MRCIHCVRSSISVWRIRARERHWRTCSGGIHASGSRPSASSSRSQRASSRSVLARRLRPRNARVSTGSARCATAPAATSASHTNSQPVHASTATCDLAAAEALRPAPDRRRRGVDPTAPHLTRLGVQRVERDLRSMHIKPGYDRHQGLLYSSGTCHLARVSRAEPEEALVHAIFARDAIGTGPARAGSSGRYVRCRQPSAGRGSLSMVVRAQAASLGPGRLRAGLAGVRVPVA